MRPLAGQVARAVGLMGLLALGAGCLFLGDRPAPLRIGTVKDSPPLAFREGRHWKGVEIELAHAMAERLGRHPVFVALPSTELLPALLNGRVDVVMAGLAITEERRVQIDFASPYLVVGQGVLVRRGDLPRVQTAIKIRSSPGRAAVVEDSPGDRLITRYFPLASRYPFSTPDDAIDALLNNRVDMVVGDGPALHWKARQRPEALALAPALFAREEIAWGFRRGSVRLRESANKALGNWQQDGTLEGILRRWMPVTP
ncbi:MAG: transporter substrate-binding domain-containing protein [Kiritimatiellae bacterium]|nr:transporter substrate-binding domain-containing protein [Kiritimatiellia bacterium]MDD4341084.1 transporter substrate-binding domain-containing protein [Kiritimatiellia bacterium]